MNAAGLAILDQSLRWSLWVFLGCFALLMLWQIGQLRARQARAARRHGTEGLAPAVRLATGSQIRLAQRALLVALAAAALTMLALALTPLPSVDNFVTSNSWRETPLRLTSIKPERTATTFALTGEFWNQTDEVLHDIQIVVRIWGTDDKVLDEILLQPTPASLQPDAAATFELSYSENAPFMAGYQIAFRDAEGTRIPHVNGFDVRR